jgi:hypothetical protein
MTRFRAHKHPRLVPHKHPLPDGAPKIHPEMAKALAEYTGPIVRCPPGRGSRRVRLKKLELPPIERQSVDDGEQA